MNSFLNDTSLARLFTLERQNIYKNRLCQFGIGKRAALIQHQV